MINRLKELAWFVSKNKVKRIEIVGEQNNYNSLVQRLYDGLSTGKYNTEEDAALDLYQDSPTNSNYRQLKYNLEKRLLNTIFHIDVNASEFTDYSKAYISCQKNTAAINILMLRGVRENAISLAERTLRIALEYEFTDIILSLARILKSHYGFYSDKRTKYLEYQSLISKYSEILNVEIKVDDYYEELISLHMSNRVLKVKNLDLLKTRIQELRTLQKTYYTPKFQTRCYQIICYYYEITNNYTKVIDTCNEAIQFFQTQSKHYSKTIIFTYKRRLIVYYTTLKEFEKAEQVGLESYEYCIEGLKNWYNVLDGMFTLYLHSKQYQKAYDILLKAQRHKDFNKLHPKDKEIWEVYNAYIHYFIRLGMIDSTPEGGFSLKKFRFYKFLNSVPNYSKDKRGINVAILILQIMFLLQEEKFDVVIERADALNQYCYKYLRKDGTYRSSCFIKMLLLLPKAQFHKAGVIRKTKTYLDKLKGNNRQTSDIEIVPYEHLWELVLESLENEFKYRARAK